VHIDLSNDTPFHRLVVQIRNIRRVDCDILLGNAVVSLCASHGGGLRSVRDEFDKRVLSRSIQRYIMKILLCLSTERSFSKLKCNFPNALQPDKTMIRHSFAFSNSSISDSS
jgi:Cys-tRNA synthase (O-phospho-L-seryl-tRNA:Cys-tRNA synthase)